MVLRLWKVTVLFSNYGNLLSTHFSRAHFLDGELISPIENSLAIQKLRHLVRLVSQGKWALTCSYSFAFTWVSSCNLKYFLKEKYVPLSAALRNLLIPCSGDSSF